METKPELHAWDEPRACEYCGETFKPKRPQDTGQKFCCDNHRKQFFKYGAKLRIVTAIRKDFDRQFKALEYRVSKLEKNLLDRKTRDVITFKPEVVQ